MCEPVTLALLGGTATAGSAAAATTSMLAIQGISAAASSVGALAGAAAQNKAANQNAQSAKDAYFLKTKQANLNIMQEQTQASQQKRDGDLKAMKAQGTAIASAGGSGVQGVNVNQLLNDFERSEGVLTDRINQRLEGMQSQNEMQKLAFQSEAQNRINSMQPQGFAETLFNVVEPIAGFGIDYYDTKARLADLEN
tara:strand:- start:50 stop:637 length:588 start_codon:yes stop_codon:yes gene_type:complete